ncbi:hypothetical protein RB614_08465 [Phytohabitans sp. ZYX-F-186]|uniref:Uncharacterized protein n=1 Tax=Phytohabitans maris TaxID=3071409 RepID=A0ABU0ZBW4_9ACTN|nr:hypothetical protein [Phytohabitans sp. ZYX-F-186]MDQ7904556.1 hypothetical protein [Phytohabitans sp. ZYX-F-186]
MTRAILRGFAKPGQRRVHMVKERDSRRREILGVIATSRVRGRVHLCDGPAVAAREACLWQLLGDLTITGAAAQLLTLESMDGQDRRDRETIARARKALPALAKMSYEQLRAHQEPLLAVADCIAWAYGAGGDWRRRIDPLIEKITELRL